MISAKWMVLINLALALAVVGVVGLAGSATGLAGAEPGYERVEVLEAGLEFDVPANWQRLGQEPAWSPTGDGEQRVGASWYHLVPTVEPEAVLLPDSGLVVASAPIALDWGTGRQYMVKDYGPGGAATGSGAPTASVEIHAIIVVADGDTLWAYDLHAVAPTEEGLAALRPFFDTMLGSVHRISPILDPGSVS